MVGYLAEFMISNFLSGRPLSADYSYILMARAAHTGQRASPWRGTAIGAR